MSYDKCQLQVKCLKDGKYVKGNYILRK